MRTIRTTAVLAGLLLAVPALSFASSQTTSQTKTPATKPAQTVSAKPAATTPAKPAAATHSTTGVVKSMDAASLVISKPSGKVKEMTFVLNASTQHKGNLAVGESVEIRYRAEGSQNVATAVTVQPKKK